MMDKTAASTNGGAKTFEDAREARFRSEFAAREKARLDRRVARYDELAEIRERKAGMRRYYLEQLKRLVGSFIMPGSRVLEIGCGFGDLIAALPGARKVGVDISARMVEKAREKHHDVELFVADVEHDELPEGPYDVIVLSDVVGHLDDIQLAMERVVPLLAPGGRVVVTYYNFVWEPVLRTAERLGMKEPWPDQNWLSMDDLANILSLADLEVVRRGTDVLVPVGVPLVSDVANLVGAKVPGLNQTALVQYFIARHVPAQIPAKLPTVSVICPCRNEKGNIREAVARTPVMGQATELIFVDGNSSDGTVEEIEAVMREHEAMRAANPNAPQLELKLILQGDGKGKGEFINGVRLVYPMEGEAMRFLNLLGNKFFSLALSWLLEQPIKDSLCGTKVLYREAYDRIAANRAFFGDFDPFGDFDLLFGAARLNMKIADLPVRYRARVYGDTKISRFAHGWLLLKMTAFGFRKLRLGV